MISVIIPIYNEEEMLKQYETSLYPIIDKLKQQFHEEFEIILVDDKSTDSSGEIIETFREEGRYHRRNA